MKRIFFLMLLALPLLWSCSDKDEPVERDGDPVPFSLAFQVTDAEGNDLLNPETPNAYGPEDIKITCTNHKGDGMDTFYVGSFTEIPRESTSYQCVKLVAFSFPIYGTDRYEVWITGYDPYDVIKWPKVEVYIEWPDGSTDYVEAHHVYYYDDHQVLHRSTTAYLNGTEVSEKFTIVK